MKIFRNPWIVGLLAIMAVLTVAYQTFHPRWPVHTPAAETSLPEPTAVATASPAPAAPVAPTPAPAMVTAIDREYASAHVSAWLAAPRRDPFLLFTKSVAAPVALPRLILKAIWRQTGDSMVAINQGIYRLGDVVEGCKIISIENNEVGLLLNGQRVALVFSSTVPR